MAALHKPIARCRTGSTENGTRNSVEGSYLNGRMDVGPGRRTGPLQPYVAVRELAERDLRTQVPSGGRDLHTAPAP